MKAIICIGGLVGIKSRENVFLPYAPNKIDYEIFSLSQKKNPKVLFIGTASKERKDYYESFKQAYESLGGIVTNLEILNNKLSNKEIKEKILSSDIIYVGCGRTQFMMDIWRQTGIDKILVEAYEKGIILAGMSAGSYCWFKYNYELIEGVGLIPMINCVHYDEKSDEKKKQFFQNIREYKLDGLAIDNDVAVAFIDGKCKVIKHNEKLNAYRITFEDGKFSQKILE